MGKKTEQLRSDLEKALLLYKERTAAMEDAYADNLKMYTELGKLTKEPRGPAWTKKKEKIDNEADINWKIYLQAKKASEKAGEEAEAAQRALSDFVTKKKETSKVIHSLKQKLTKLKAILK